MVERGYVPAGDRVPATRPMRQKLQVAFEVASRALVQLVVDGGLEAPWSREAEDQ